MDWEVVRSTERKLIMKGASTLYQAMVIESARESNPGNSEKRRETGKYCDTVDNIST